MLNLDEDTSINLSKDLLAVRLSIPTAFMDGEFRRIRLNGGLEIIQSGESGE